MRSPDHKRCLGCGYILNGLPEPRCPECGRGFDPDDRRTYLWEIKSGRPYLVAAVLCLAGHVAFVFLRPPESIAGFSYDVWNFCHSLVFLVAAIGTGVVAVRAFGALRGPRHAVRHRLSFVIAFLLSAPLLALLIGSFALFLLGL